MGRASYRRPDPLPTGPPAPPGPPHRGDRPVAVRLVSGSGIIRITGAAGRAVRRAWYAAPPAEPGGRPSAGTGWPVQAASSRRIRRMMCGITVSSCPRATSTPMRSLANWASAAPVSPSISLTA